jgi:hypothetical protein
MDSYKINNTAAAAEKVITIKAIFPQKFRDLEFL